MAYDTQRLDELARDRGFVELVRKLAGELITADPKLTDLLLPVCHYGPDRPAVVLRLGPHLRIDVRQLPDGDLTARLVYVQQTLLTAETDGGS